MISVYKVNISSDEACGSEEIINRNIICYGISLMVAVKYEAGFVRCRVYSLNIETWLTKIMPNNI